MKQVKRSSTYTAPNILTADPDSNQMYITITHEFGDAVQARVAVTRNGVGDYSYDLTATHTQAAGKLKLYWDWKESTVTKTKTDYIDIYDEYISAANFFDLHSTFETDFDDSFQSLERRVAGIIDTFCGQSFNSIISKTIKLDGTNGRNLYLPLRLESLTSVTSVTTSADGADSGDITIYVEVHPESKFFLRMKALNAEFNEDAEYHIVGDWGWPYVPQNITNASELLLLDIMNDDSTYRQHGIQEVDMDTHRLRLHPTIYGSTGNIDADVLLMDYTMWILTYI